MNGVNRGGSFTHYGYGVSEYRNSGIRRQLPRGTAYYVVGFRLNGVERRVDRGARWMLASDYVRASYRDVSKVVAIQDIIGFRLNGVIVGVSRYGNADRVRCGYRFSGYKRYSNYSDLGFRLCEWCSKGD